MSGNESQLGIIPGRGSAANRFADALLRSNGFTQVTLRLPDPASGDSGGQLGLEPPPSEDIQISPAMVRLLSPATDGRGRIEVILSATATRVLARKYQVEDIPAWLLGAQGVLYRDRLLRIESVTIDHVLGSDCLFHLIASE